jgi:hypothetical protein
MSSLKQVSVEIQRFLASEQSEALCISGDWGIGKTYTWNILFNAALENGKLAKRRYSYVSLFGINNLEALKLSVFENTKILVDPTTDDPNLKRALEIGSSTLTFAQKGRFILAAIPAIGKVFSEAGPLYFAAVTDQIVCIDDLERRGPGLSVNEVLGLVSFLKEQRNCKVVLLLNDQGLGADEEAFKANFEKVFDGLLRFLPTAAESARIAISGDDTVATKIRENCEKLAIANIRVIKKIERFARMVEPLLQGRDLAVMHQALHTLTLFCWSKYQPSLAPPRDFFIEKRMRGYFGVTKREELSEEEVKWNQILNDYNFQTTDAFDRAILTGIDNGFYDPEIIGSAADEQDANLKANGVGSLFNKAWEMYRDSFDDNEKDLVAAMILGVEQTPFISASNLEASVTLLKELGHRDEALEMIRAYVDRTEGNERFWDLKQDPFGNKITDPDIITAFEAKKESVKVAPDLKAVLINIEEKSGGSSEDIAFLATVSIDEYRSLFIAARDKELRQLIRAGLTFANIVNADANMIEATNRVNAALDQIASTNPLNARRVASLKMMAGR